MKGSAIIAVAAGLTASLVSAQLDKLPQCALGCALPSIGQSGCGAADVACICKAEAFISNLIPCVKAACSQAEYDVTVKAAQALCLQVGVTLSIPSATSTQASSSEVPSVTASKTETETETETETTKPSTPTATTTIPSYNTPGNSTITTVTSAKPSSGAVETTGTPSTTVTTPTRPPNPSSTGAAGRNTVALGGLSAILALFAALL